MKRGKETVLNISKRKLTNAEYRLLGKGLKFCPKQTIMMYCNLNKIFLNSQES